MKSRVSLFTLICVCAGFSACQSPSPATPPISRASADVTMTTAWGKLVDDPSGQPLRGVRVALEPWKPCRPVPFVPMYLPPWTHKNWPPPSAWPHPEHLVCPSPVTVTKTDRNGKFTIRARKGHYLLAIGSDATTDLVRPTIHDNVVLTGGIQHLTAPTPCPQFTPTVRYQHCMPQIPLVMLPRPELSRDYRLSTIDPKYEIRCIKGYNYERRQRNLEAVVIDEWLTENNRNSQRFAGSKRFYLAPWAWAGGPALSSGFADTQGGTGVKRLNGHPGCWTWNTRTAFFYNFDALPYSIDPRSHWYAGTYGQFNKLGKAGNLLGASQFPRDPRSVFLDGNVPIWP
jgi:hypothetical protein